MDDDDGSARSGYCIFRPERVSLGDIFRLLFTRRTITDYDFVDDSGGGAGKSPAAGGASGVDLKTRCVVAVVLLVQMMLAGSGGVLGSVGRGIEFLLNLPSFNGGFRGLLWRLVTASVVKPRPGAKEFRSIIAHLNGRLGLGRGPLVVPSPAPDDVASDIKLTKYLRLTAMAASRAYDNEANITDIVNNHWKMHFVKFYNCWNKFFKKNATQAFIFCDRAEDASLICVAFRGTKVFDAADWITDNDFSFVSLGAGRGRVHLGFMKALGLQDETDVAKGFPKEEPPPPPPTEAGKGELAYYAIRRTLTELAGKHPAARILVTGHSLGGALAALFPAVLACHGEAALLKRMAVIPHAQPRVGDGVFAKFMTNAVCERYLRTVYRYDMVPRVPPTSRLLSFFTHFGTCVYYKHWYAYEKVETVPNWNYFNPVYNARMYWSVWEDVFWAFYLREGIASVVYRLVVGILVPVVGPGIVSHSTRNYLNGAEYANKEDEKKKKKTVTMTATATATAAPAPAPAPAPEEKKKTL